jgi:hypothetical protein
MGFGRFPPSSGQPFGRKTARDGEFADGRQPHGRDGAANADRRAPSLGPKSAPGWHAHPRRENPAAALNTASEERAELGPDTARPAEPDAAAGLDSWSGDDDSRFAGLAAPSPLVAELAAGGARAAPPPAAARGMAGELEQNLGGPGANADEDQDGDLPVDEIEDIAVTIGRVVGIHGSVLWGTLYDDEDNTAASAARMGALVSLRGPESRVFGVVNALRRERDGGGSQGERTVFEIQTLGEIPTSGPDAEAGGFRRGVSRYPPLGAPVTTVTIRDLAKV